MSAESYGGVEPDYWRGRSAAALNGLPCGASPMSVFMCEIVAPAFGHDGPNSFCSCLFRSLDTLDLDAAGCTAYTLWCNCPVGRPFLFKFHRVDFIIIKRDRFAELMFDCDHIVYTVVGRLITMEQ